MWLRNSLGRGVCVAKYLLPDPVGRDAVKCGKVRGDRTWRSRQPSGFHRRTDDLFCSDVNHTRRIQSRNTGPLHTLLSWFLIRDFHDLGSTTFRDEHESCQKFCSSIACQKLACNAGFISRRQLSACWLRWRCFCGAAVGFHLLCKTAPRQQQTMHLPPQDSASLRQTCLRRRA